MLLFDYPLLCYRQFVNRDVDYLRVWNRKQNTEPSHKEIDTEKEVDHNEQETPDRDYLRLLQLCCQVKTNPAGLIVDGRGRLIEACLYGEEHKLIAKDTYSVRNAAIYLVSATRQGTDGTEVSFSQDETAILHQFAGENKRETLAM